MRVGDDQRVAAAQRGDHGQVGVVAGREDQRGRLSEVRRELALELGVQLEGPGDQPRGAGAGAPSAAAAAAAASTTAGSRDRPR